MARCASVAQDFRFCLTARFVAMCFVIAAENGIDAGLIASALTAEPRHHVGIQAHRYRLLVRGGTEDHGVPEPIGACFRCVGVILNSRGYIGVRKSIDPLPIGLTLPFLAQSPSCNFPAHDPDPRSSAAQQFPRGHKEISRRSTPMNADCSTNSNSSSCYIYIVRTVKFEAELLYNEFPLGEHERICLIIVSTSLGAE